MISNNQFIPNGCGHQEIRACRECLESDYVDECAESARIQCLLQYLKGILEFEVYNQNRWNLALAAIDGALRSPKQDYIAEVIKLSERSKS